MSTASEPLTVGVLSPLAGGFYFSSVLTGIASTAGAAGGRVIAIQTLEAGREHADVPADYMFDSRIGSSNISGFISVLNSADPAYLAEITRSGKPLVLVSHEVRGMRVPAVLPDNRGGISQAVRHLVEHGHTRIAFAGFLAHHDMHDRYEAYRDALRDVGIEPDPALVFETGDALRSGGLRAGAAMLAAGPLPTATVAATDLNAIGIMATLAAAGYSLPRDHAIVGFDDHEAAEYAVPALTTVRQSFQRTGNHAAQLLLRAIGGEPVSPGRHVVPTGLVIRQSCGCSAWQAPPLDVAFDVAASARDVLARELADTVAPPSDTFGDHQRARVVAERVADLVEASVDGDAAEHAAELREAITDLYRMSPTRTSVSSTVERLRAYARAKNTSISDAAQSRKVDDAVLGAMLALGGAGLARAYDDNNYFRGAIATQYDVNMALLRGHERDPRALDWLRRTRSSAGVLGIWDDEGKATLKVAGSFSREDDADSHDFAPTGATVPLASFPPAALLSCPSRPGDILYAVPVKSGASDWGWLATIGPIETREFTGRETLNQWAALLTVALDEAAAADGVKSLERELRAILETSPDAIARYDAQLRYAYLNASAATSIGLPPEQIVGRTDQELRRDAAVASVWETGLREVLATGAATEVEFSDGTAHDSSWFQAKMVPQFDPTGAISGVLTSTRDITQTKRAELALAHQAVHDALTGLANRVLFLDRLSQALTRMERAPGRLAVLFVDLDGFKEINDTLGHEVGDQLLREVAQRLEGVSRRVDTVARFGGDEFIMLCDKLAAEEDVRIIAERVVRALARPYGHDEANLAVSGSVGVVVASDPYHAPDALIRDADSAMYQAKSRGGNRFYLFDPVLRDRTADRLELETDLRTAVGRHELFLVYQPLFALGDGSITGVEALLRWEHPSRGLLSPAEFMPVAEQRGLIVDIGAWVVDEACRQLAQWTSRDGLADLTMAVNISSRQLADPELVRIVGDALAKHRIRPARLTLEMAETTLVEDAANMRETLTKLAALGVHLALDDFGTGYSALAHLRDFPVDILKIDRSFVEQLGDGGRAREMVGALTAMAHFLDMTVVGEGIETSKQWDELKQLHCDDGQGFVMARPMSPHDLLALVKAARSS